MKKYFKLSFGIFLTVASLSLAAIFLATPTKAAAASFNPANIISDNVFTNNGSMSIQDIQNFLNAQMPNCDTNGTQSFSYYYDSSTGRVGSGSDGNDSRVTTTRQVYGQRYDSFNGVTTAATPYVCLKSYVEDPNTGNNNLQNPGATIANGASAAQIIWSAAQTAHINPQVILVTLQKEQGLVSDDWPWPIEYQEAMGYNCPDTPAGCSGHSGFIDQVDSAANQFRNYLTHPNSFNYVAGQNNYVLYAPGCSGSTVFIQTSGTAALYDYTPYQPDSNVLASTNAIGSNNGPGGSVSGDSCGAYGNRNFWWYFNTWFGSTTGVDYSWSVQDVSILQNGTQLPNSNVQGNSNYTVKITALNTGNQSWSSTNFPVRLGTFLPTNHNSALYDSSWPAYNRPANMDQSSVLPGSTGTFTFKINVPNITEAYDESFDLAAEGATWFPGNGYNLHLVITKSSYTWQMVSQTSDKGFSIAPGNTAQITLVAKNTGNVTWSNSTNPVRLGTWSPANRISPLCSDNTSWAIGCTRAAVLQQSTVAPGSNGTFIFTIQAPQKEGLYAEHFNLVMDGVTWFEDPGMEFDINVSRVLTWQMISEASNQGFSLSPGQSAQFTLIAKNTGNMTWSNTTNPVRLGTWSPPNRSSVFNASWANPARPATLQESSVAPGSNGTFVFSVKAPQNKGVYAERFNLAMDGVAWMTDPWLEFDINVN